MTKLNVALAFLLVASSLYLVRTSYEARQMFAALDKAKNEQARLEADHQRLEAERQHQATSLNVDRKARERLQMRSTNPAVTQYVQDKPVATAPKLGSP